MTNASRDDYDTPWKAIVTHTFAAERNRHMPYITSVERIGMEKGMQKGIQQGIQQGKQLGAVDMLLRQIERRFGPPSDVVRERISQADSDTLMQWSERMLDAQSLEDLWH
jgi:hypothetical protein